MKHARNAHASAAHFGQPGELLAQEGISIRNYCREESPGYEYPMTEDIPPPPPPPGKDRHLGKQAVRCISERIVGIIEYDERKGLIIKGPGGRKIPLDKLPSLLDSCEGFRIELKVYEDHDPDVLYRMAEALEGWGGIFTSNHSESIYVERIRQELDHALPGAIHRVRLQGETIHVTIQEGEKKEWHFSLASPGLGEWILKYREGKAWTPLCSGISFVEGVQSLIRVVIKG